MAEKSWVWTCAEVGDGGANSFSQEVVMTLLSGLTNTVNPETDGVFYWGSSNTNVFSFLGLGAFAPTGLLEPTNPSGSTVRIANGLGLCGGIFYINTGNIDFDVSVVGSGFANAVDVIAMRRTVGSQTVRLVYIPATGAGLTAPLTNTDITWDVPICYVNLSGAGAFSSITDVRVACNQGRVLLDKRTVSSANQVDFQNIPQIFTKLWIEHNIDTGTPTGGATFIAMRFNGISTANSYIQNGYSFATLSGILTSPNNGLNVMFGDVDTYVTYIANYNTVSTGTDTHPRHGSLTQNYIYRVGGYYRHAISGINRITFEANNYPTGTIPMTGTIKLYAEV